ncbi:MAG: hypothetical protein KatS3mg110_3209 [Pirellulaceae bacterium]|nr:MAG: hypothetical protein KatS3mg110_3204 [Pirellulaceae bacterium]GIW95168.1 MAG: hypothetical protein KatS3mg110_3209 [Pirellulaceae bacterium]
MVKLCYPVQLYATQYLAKRCLQLIDTDKLWVRDVIGQRILEDIVNNRIFRRVIKNIVSGVSQHPLRIPLPAADEAQDREQVTRFLDDLQDYGFIPEYSIRPGDPTLLILHKPLTPYNLSFLSGRWLEEYVVHSVFEALAPYSPDSLKWDYLYRAKYGWLRQVDGEIDCFVLLNDMPIVVESKTGHTNEKAVRKFARLASKLAVPRSFAVFVTVCPVAETADSTEMVTIVSPRRFREYFSDIVGQIVAA